MTTDKLRCWRGLALLAALLLPACSSSHYQMGTPLSATDIPDPANGVQLAQVLDKLGPPQRISATADGYAMAWEYWHITKTSLGVNIGAAGIDLAMDWGNAKTSGDFLLLGFSHEHRLRTRVFEEWDRDAASGRGVQPLFGLVEIVDVDDLREPLPQHRWGAGSLQKLPVTLNNDNRMGTGQNGIEQRGTGRKIGQHSLEMD